MGKPLIRSIAEECRRRSGRSESQSMSSDVRSQLEGASVENESGCVTQVCRSGFDCGDEVVSLKGVGYVFTVDAADGGRVGEDSFESACVPKTRF